MRIRGESKIGGDEVLVRVINIGGIAKCIAVVIGIHGDGEIDLTNIAGACDSVGRRLGSA